MRTKSGGGGKRQYEIQPSFSLADILRENTAKHSGDDRDSDDDHPADYRRSDRGDSVDNDHEEETLEDYRKGGYHPIYPGDTLKSGRYRIVRKLGWGHFSTVWLATDKFTRPDGTRAMRYVAIKIVKSARRYTEAAKDEISMFECINRHKDDLPAGVVTAKRQPAVVEMFDSFTLCGPNGTHVCMVFEVLGENLLTTIRRFEYRGIPVSIVRRVARQLLEGLDYLHRICGIIHTDLKPENVCLCIDGDGDGADAEEGEKQLVVLGGGLDDRISLIEKHFGIAPSSLVITASSLSEGSAGQSAKASAADIQPHGDKVQISRNGGAAHSLERTLSNISLEALPVVKPSSNDTTSPQTGRLTGQKRVHSAESLPSQSKRANSPAKPLFPAEMSTETANSSPQRQTQKQRLEEHYSKCNVKLTDLGNACWIDHHFTEDIQTRQYRSPEVLIGADYDETTDLWSLACMLFELLTGDYLFEPHSSQHASRDEGSFPRDFALSGEFSREFFNRSGKLRNIDRLDFWPLHEVLRDKYGFEEQEGRQLADFLLPMLEPDPKRRATASKMLKHPWLNCS